MTGCIAAIAAGIICGSIFFTETTVFTVKKIYEPLLYLLLISVGFSAGGEINLYNLKKTSKAFLLLPIITITATLAAGLLCGGIFGYPPAFSHAVASGLSFSGISGAIITETAGTVPGALAFAANLIRELLSFIFVPLVAKKLNIYSAISLCASTAGDTLLPLISKQDLSAIVPAVYNGIVCTALAPMLVRFFIGL